MHKMTYLTIVVYRQTSSEHHNANLILTVDDIKRNYNKHKEFKLKLTDTIDSILNAHFSLNNEHQLGDIVNVLELNIYFVMECPIRELHI